MKIIILLLLGGFFSFLAKAGTISTHCVGPEDWYIDVDAGTNKISLTNSKVGVHPKPWGDEYYTIYSDTEDVTYLNDGQTITFSGDNYKLVISSPNVSDQGPKALFYRYDKKSNTWKKYSYRCYLPI